MVLNWCATTLLLALPILVLLGSARSVHKLSGPEEWTFPHVTLEQAFHGEADITPETPQMMTRHDTRTRLPPVPGAVRLVELWRGPGSDGYTGDAIVAVDFYRTRTDWAAEWLFSSLAGGGVPRAGAVPEKPGAVHPPHRPHRPASLLQTVDHPGLDRLEYTALQYDDAPPNHIYLGRRGCQVFRLLCRGVPDQAECLALFLAQLDP